MTDEFRDDAEAFLGRFARMPKRHAGQEVLIEFVLEGEFRRADDPSCDALGLPPGETVVLPDQPVLPGSHRFNLFACGDLAEDLLKVKEGATSNVRARAAFWALAPSTARGRSRPSDRQNP